jgi:nucleoporin NUP2
MDGGKDKEAPKSTFSGFSFGKTTAPAEKAADRAAAAKPAFSGFNFGKTAAPAPAAASASSSSAKEPAPPAQRVSSGIVPSQSAPPHDGEVAYYTALRGLNAAFLSFVSKSITSNEFIDLGTVMPELLRQYEGYLSESSAKAGWKPPAAAPSAPTTAVVSVNDKKEVEKAKEPEKEKEKAPSFTFGAPKKNSDAVNAVAAAVLAEKEPQVQREEPKKDKAAFSFGSSAPKPGLFSFAPSGPLAPTTPDSKTFSPSEKLGKFGADGATPQLSFGKAGTPSKGPSTGFSFGADKAADKPDQPFSFGKPASNPVFSFGSGTAVAAKDADKPAFSFGTSSTDKPADKADKPAEKPAFSFGSSSATPADKPADKPAFSFSSSSGSGFTFGGSQEKDKTEEKDKPADKPAFSFGSSSAAPPKPTSTFSFGSSAPTFSFGSSTSTPGASTPTSTTPAPAATPAEPEAGEEGSKNLAEAEGAGEENETTVYEQRGRLYDLEGGKNTVVGLGQLKLKRSEDGKRRLLMRADGSGTVVLNMGLHDAFKATSEGKHVRFIGFDLEGKMKPFALMVKTPDLGKALVEALTKEVEALKK